MTAFYMTVRIPGGDTVRFREDAPSGADAINRATQLYGPQAQVSAIRADPLKADGEAQDAISLDPDSDSADWPKKGA